MYCGECGTKVSPASMFCGECGAFHESDGTDVSIADSGIFPILSRSTEYGTKRYITTGAVVVGIFATICILLFISYFVAIQQIERLVVSSNLELKKEEEIVFQVDYFLRKEIKPEILANLIRDFNTDKQRILFIRAQIVDGHGMFFWLTARREHIGHEIDDRITRLTAVLAVAPDALKAVATINGKVVDAVTRTVDARTSAIAALGEDADIIEFKTASRSIEAQLLNLQTVALEVDRFRVQGAVSALDSKLRLSLIQGMSAQLKDETTKARARLDKTRQAVSLLSDHRDVMLSLVARTGGMASTLRQVNSDLQPNIKIAHDYSKPLREFLKQGNEPIATGMMGAMLNTINGGNKVSALGLIRQTNPATDAAIGAIEGLCTLVETADSEMSELANVNMPLATAIDDFTPAGSRHPMIALAHASKTAANYYSNKATVFDPLLQKIESMQGYVNLLNQTVDQLSIPIAQSIVKGIASETASLINSIGQPLKRGKALIIDFSRTLGSMSEREDTYLRNLKSLVVEDK